jgi:hypothetical protein
MTKQLIATALFLVASTSNAFVIRAPVKASTKLFLEDWVADFIDSEKYRQDHMKDFEAEWMEKNRAAVLSRMESDFMPNVDDAEDFRMHNKDKKMAFDHPDKYCADRCLTTGHCDIYEDLYVSRKWK